MIKTFKACLLLPATLFCTNSLHAQDSDTAPKSNSQNIIIHKKDSTKEKITVVIDGDNVTVNGKPIDDFVSADVDIIKQDLNNSRFNVFFDGMPPIAPAPPQVEAFKNDMMRSIKSNTAFLGVMTEQTEQGAKITDITEGSAAEKAGLKEGDIITKIAGDKITGPDDLYKVVGKHKPDEKVVITYVRDGKTLNTNATFGKSDQMKIYSWNSPDGNMPGRSLPPNGFFFSWGSDKPHLGISAQDTEDGNGVKILDIDDEDSPASKAGLKEGDIITQVNGKAINSTDDLKQNVKELKKGDTVKITYKRNSQTQTVDVKLPKELKTIDL